MSRCIECDKELNYKEIALYRKLINRGATEYMCLQCLAKTLNVTTDLLEERIEYFKKTGCALFS